MTTSAYQHQKSSRRVAPEVGQASRKRGERMLLLQLAGCLVALLVYIPQSRQESKAEAVSSSSRSQSKLWLNGKPQEATGSSSQYLNVLNDTRHPSNLTRLHSPTEDVLEASESRLSLISSSPGAPRSNFTTSGAARSKQVANSKKDSAAKQHKPNARKPSKPDQKTSSQQQQQQSSSKFFKTPGKLSISALLTKSKRQDSLPDSKARKVRTGRKLVVNRYARVRPPHAFHLARGPFVPAYATAGSHHLLFGSQLPLPADFYAHFGAHPAAASPPELVAAPSATLRHLNAQFQTQQTMPQPFHQSSVADFRPGSPGELAPSLFFPGPPPPTKPLHLIQAETHNGTAKAQVNQQQQQQQQKGAHQNKNSVAAGNSSSHHPLSLPLGAAAAALFSERAKNFISHLNRGGSSKRAKEQAKETRSTTPEPAKQAPATGGAGSSGLLKAPPTHDNVGLASMMKNAADTWTGASTSSEAAPSILVEHDGPTITTVNFDQHHNLNGPIGAPPPPGRSPYDDDEDQVNSYYESNEEEESEVGGSHEAHRVFRFRGQQQQQPTSGHHHHRHHSIYPVAGHPLVPLRHLPQPRHVPYPPRYPHSRYPFEQQVQSHTIHTEVPFEMPYVGGGGGGGGLNYGAADSDYGPAELAGARKKGYGEFPQGPLQDYLSRQRLVDQPQIYPDSINAIKEQNNGDQALEQGAGAKLAAGELTGNMGSKLSASNSDQIDLLIKELQELNKMKRNQSAAAEQAAGAGHQRKVRLPASSLEADYEDSFGSAGSGSSGGSGGDDDEADERFRVLRRKLLNRLRNKARGGGGRTRGGGGGAGNNGDDSFHSEAIKIPLHALLLAALDRRMSSSEAHSQSVASSAEPAPGDGSAGSTSEGPAPDRKWAHLMEPGPSSTLALSRQQDFNEITSGLGSLLTTLNDSPMDGSETGSTTSQLATSTEMGSSNARSGSQVNQSADFQTQQQQQQQQQPQAPSMFILNNIRLPDQLSIGAGNESALRSTIESSLELIRKAQNESFEDQLVSTPTTRMPAVVGADSAKKRRQVQQELDFDVGKQVEEFTRDVRTDHLGLPPDWAARKGPLKLEHLKRGHQEASSPSSVHFDDDFEESRGSRASKVNAANSGRRRKSAAKRAKSAVMDSDDAADFLNKVRMDTGSDLDSSHQVEDPIGLASQEELHRREEKAAAEELLSEHLSDAEDEPEGRSADKDSDETASLAAWKPQVIDEEVRRLEKLAGGGGGNARKKQSSLVGDYTGDGDDNDNQTFDGDAQDSGKAGAMESADTVMKVTIDSKDGSSARITQHFSGSKPLPVPRRRRVPERKKSS